MTQRKYITEYSAEKVREVFAAIDSGKNSNVVSKLTGVPGRTVRALSQARKEGKLITRRGEHEKPVIEHAKPSSMPIEQVWKIAEEVNEAKIEEALNLHRFNSRFDDNLPIAISFASDQHISVGNTVSLKKMRYDAELMAATDGMNVVCVGDAIDNHIKHRSAMVHSRSTPGDQYKLLDYYLSMIREKLLVLVSGNHDDWTNQFAGVDVLKMIADKNQVLHAPDEARISVGLPGFTYEIAARHQYRYNSTLNETNSAKQWWKMGTAPFDIGNIAHLHTVSLEPVMFHGLERWVCRSGSYQITSSYSRQLGFNPATPSCPTFVIYPDHRQIVGFTNLPAATRFLTYERKRYIEAERASSRLSARAATKSHVRRIQAAQRVGKSRRGAK